MRYGQLSDYFTGVSVKRLARVDAGTANSNQHEVGTTLDMRNQFLGERDQIYQMVYIWLGQDLDGYTVEGTAHHYDTREQQDRRNPEWRLYYPTNRVTDAMRERDSLFLAKDNNNILYFIVAPADSTSEHQLLWLFGLQTPGDSFEYREFMGPGHQEDLDFAARYILNEIGVEFEVEFEKKEAEKIDSVIEQFDDEFPTTREFSEIARKSLPEVQVDVDPDAALMAWVDQEEAMFRRLERRIVSKRLEEGFRGGNRINVDDFIKYSLSVQNRRKSRRGYSLENHLEAVFLALNIGYVRGTVTELRYKPDFLFPSAKAYKDAPAEGHPCLTMLGAKSTCRERWRQVLKEASKIPKKHLLTLEPRITVSQTEQMAEAQLQLVVPSSIQISYTEEQRCWLLNLNDFIEVVNGRA